MNYSFFGFFHYFKLFERFLGLKVYAVLGLSLLSGLVEGLGIILLIPILASLSGEPSGGFGLDEIQGPLLGNLLQITSELPVVTLLGLATLCFTMKGMLMFSILSYKSVLQAELVIALKSSLIRDFISIEYQQYVMRSSGSLVNLVNEQTNRALGAFGSLVNLASYFINTSVYVFLAFSVQWKFGLMAAFAGILLLFAFVYLNRRVHSLSVQSATESGKLADSVVQTFGAFKYLRASGQTDFVKTTLNESVRTFASVQKKVGIIAAFTVSVREPIAVALIAVIVSAQIEFFSEPVGPILVSILLFYRGLTAMVMVQEWWQRVLESIGSMELVSDEVKQITPEGWVPTEDQNSTKADDVVRVKHIQFVDVKFDYDRVGSSRESFGTMEFEFKSDDIVGVVGASGSGKTTLLDILAGILLPQAGDVLINGNSIRTAERLLDWQRSIGYVTQDNLLFRSSIRDNLCMGRKLSDHDLWRVLESVDLAGHVRTMPDGLDTFVGEDGVLLSGGQRQRLFIARELLRDISILLLDEPTSALDKGTESLVVRSIQNFACGIPIVMATHNVSLLESSTMILVLDDRRIIARGSFAELASHERIAHLFRGHVGRV